MQGVVAAAGAQAGGNYAGGGSKGQGSGWWQDESSYEGRTVIAGNCCNSGARGRQLQGGDSRGPGWRGGGSTGR